jgi:hypothetical protein
LNRRKLKEIAVADRELLAATLTAGMLPTIAAPPTSKKTEREEVEISQAVAQVTPLVVKRRPAAFPQSRLAFRAQIRRLPGSARD